MTRPLTVAPLTGIGSVRVGDDLAALLWESLLRCTTANHTSADLDPGDVLQRGDVVAVSSKLVSKARGLTAPDGDRQRLVLRECRRVVAERATSTGVTRVVESRAGPVMVGAGIDGSNTGAGCDLLLLPHDPDAEADALRAALATRAGHDGFGVVLTDTAGRPWRAGLVDLAIGCSGLDAVEDLRGTTDSDGRPLAVTVRAVADEIAAAADLVKGKATGIPAALLRGLDLGSGTGTARSLVRTGPGDWFSLGAAEAVRAALGIDAGSALSEQVGLIPMAPDDVVHRVARTVRVALDPIDLAAVVTWENDRTPVVHVQARPEQQAYAAARLEVAASAERLAAQLRPDWSVVLTDR